MMVVCIPLALLLLLYNVRSYSSLVRPTTRMAGRLGKTPRERRALTLRRQAVRAMRQGRTPAAAEEAQQLRSQMARAEANEDENEDSSTSVDTRGRRGVGRHGNDGSMPDQPMEAEREAEAEAEEEEEEGVEEADEESRSTPDGSAKSVGAHSSTSTSVSKVQGREGDSLAAMGSRVTQGLSYVASR